MGYKKKTCDKTVFPIKKEVAHVLNLGSAYAAREGPGLGLVDPSSAYVPLTQCKNSSLDCQKPGFLCRFCTAKGLKNPDRAEMAGCDCVRPVADPPLHTKTMNYSQVTIGPA